MQLGIEVLRASPALLKKLKGKRLGVVAHPASLDRKLMHTVDALAGTSGLKVTCAFGPQHGIRGDVQDNMIESDDFEDPKLHIPIFSLYGKVRKPTEEMWDACDVVLYDLQDVGSRIYTYVATLLYLLQGAAERGKSVWVLDRPNPAGRPIEGTLLRPGFETFVGCAPIPMRHGLTMGELAEWMVDHFKLEVDLTVVAMKGYKPNAKPGLGWPVGELPWINPSPNIPNLYSCRVFPGMVLLEGTHLSEGRGSTRPFEMVGCPDFRAEAILAEMKKLAPKWLGGAPVRTCFFEPTFHKHQGKLCEGFFLHTDSAEYKHAAFQPYRWTAVMLKAYRNLHPDAPLWREFPYEYITDILPFDALTGGDELRAWVDDPAAKTADLERLLAKDESAWRKSSAKYLRYK